MCACASNKSLDMVPREVNNVYVEVYNAPDIFDDASNYTSGRVHGEVANATKPCYIYVPNMFSVALVTAPDTPSLMVGNNYSKAFEGRTKVI